VVPAVLAAASALGWGVADFWGGLLARRLPLVGVVLFSQAAGVSALLLLAAAGGLGVGGAAFALGALGGLCGGAGIAAYYRALAIGTMSIVAPVAACGVLIPFALALAEGERPTPLALAGAALAIGGAVLASFHEQRGGGAGREAIVLAVVTALMFGGLLYLLGRGSKEGDSFSALLGARSGSLSLLVAWALLLRPAVRPPQLIALAGVAIVGLLGTGANGLYALAAERGLLSLVSVLASLYPVGTVLLAHALLGERLLAAQRAGVALALAGVALVVLG
jgi:drug/metabolite transporter (DMT)-like permease